MAFLGPLLGAVLPTLIGGVLSSGRAQGSSPYTSSVGNGASTQRTQERTSGTETINNRVDTNEAGTQTTVNDYDDENINEIDRIITKNLLSAIPALLNSGNEVGQRAQENFGDFSDAFLPALLQGINTQGGADAYENSPERAIALRFLEDARGQQNVAFAGRGFNDVGALGGSRQAGADNLLQGRVAENLASSITDRALQERLGFINAAPGAIDAAARLPGAGIEAQLAPIKALASVADSIRPNELTRSTTQFDRGGTQQTDGTTKFEGTTRGTTTGTENARRKVTQNPAGISVGDILTNVISSGVSGYNAYQNTRPKPPTVYPTTNPLARQGTIYKSGGA